MMTMTGAALPGSVERRSEARRLTDLLETSNSFTYLRLCDGELALLLEWQSGNEPSAVRKSGSSLKSAYSVNGLRGTVYARLQQASNGAATSTHFSACLTAERISAT